MTARSIISGLLTLFLTLAIVPTGYARGLDQELEVRVDKAQYQPGEPVTVSVSAAADSDVELELNHLGRTIATATVTTNADGTALWRVVPPETDFRGYMVYADSGSASKTTAIDVSSTWTRYPRMGFLDTYDPSLNADQQRAMLDELAQDYHLNVLQFYDWMWRHEEPIKRLDGELPESWTAWNGDVISPAVVKSLIQEGAARGMAALPYSMSYAALQGFEANGVSADWRLRYGSSGDDWKFEMWQNTPETTLWIMDPSNENWVSHMTQRYQDQIHEFGFDGTHLDQLGNWGSEPNGGMIDADNRSVDLPVAFGHLIDETERITQATAGLNAVDGFGSLRLAESRSDYLYSELWGRHETWQQVDSYLQRQRLESGGKPHVLAAYANNKYQVGQIVEAENGTFTGGVAVDTDHPGFSGTGFVDQFGEPGQSVTVQVTADEARRYGIVPKWSNNTGATAWRTILVDGVEIGRARLGTTGSWDSWSNEAGLSIDLTPGTHSVTFRVDDESDGYINLDSIALSSFDTPSVKLLNAALASMGAHHIEMGQDSEMLVAPYFPDDTKQMSFELREWMQDYYDVITGYESLLFGPGLHESGLGVNVDGIPTSDVPTPRTLWTRSMHNEGYTIIHLVNMLNETDEKWRNPTSEFEPVRDASVRIELGDQPIPEEVFAASPDLDGGRAIELPFTSGSSPTGNWVRVQVPSIDTWTMVYMGEPADGHVINRGSQCLDIAATDPQDGAPVKIADCSDDPSQTWSYTGGQLSTQGLCLDAVSEGASNGTEVTVASCSSDPSQRWLRTPYSQFKHAQSELCLDVVGASMTSGTRLHLWQCHVGSSQKWTEPQ